MTPEDFIFREIEPTDNTQIARVIRNVLEEFDAPTTGTAYEDKATDNMHAAYQGKKESYSVVVYKNTVVGGAGFSHLSGADATVCEFQKMYFLPVARKKGLAGKLLQYCLQKATAAGFTQCYLETMPNMKSAQALYKKNGFELLDQPLGNTGHCSCSVWMLKKL